MQKLNLNSLLITSFLLISPLFFSQLINAQERKLAPKTIDNAIIITPLGEIEIELYPEQAPITVANFVKYIKAGAYNGGRFYRVVRLDNDQGSPKIQVVQGGTAKHFTDFSAIPLENTATTKIKHLDGVLSMARDTENSATSEFFICIGEQPSLDYGGLRNPDGLGFAAFGRVTKGMEIIKTILNIKDTLKVEDDYVKDQMLSKPILITKIMLS